jgi:uncharacterized protein
LSSPILILPGIGNSGPQHWQTLWEQSNPDFQRVQQRDWGHPVCEEWCAVLEIAARNAGPHAILVAHSLACLVVAHWAASSHAPIRAALLVAPPDATGPNFPKEAVGFTNTPTQPLTFPSVVVMSDNDPYGSKEHSMRLAKAWESKLINIGSFGHINASSGLGAWPQGYELLNQLRR